MNEIQDLIVMWGVGPEENSSTHSFSLIVKGFVTKERAEKYANICKELLIQKGLMELGKQEFAQKKVPH